VKYKIWNENIPKKRKEINKTKDMRKKREKKG
jgi:hypothetical protein